jgi:hypothetical protein
MIRSQHFTKQLDNSIVCTSEFGSQFPNNTVCHFVEKCMICVLDWVKSNQVMDQAIPKPLA